MLPKEPVILSPASAHNPHALPRAATQVTNVYIASNQINETDTVRVAELMNVSGLKLHSLLLEPSLTEHMELDEISRFEQGICTRASAFVDTPKSTWSANVDAFRG